MFDWFSHLRGLSLVLDTEVRATLAEDPVAALSSWNGYVREAALKHFAHQPSPAALKQIVLRLNDWVPQVRQAAERAFMAHLVPHMADAWIDGLDEVSALGGKTRAEHAAKLAAVERFLKEHAFEKLRAALKSDRKASRRYAFDLLVVGPYRERQADLKSLVLGGDCVLSINALRHFCEAEDLPHVKLAAKSPHAQVRLAALRWLDAQGHGLDADEEMQFLLDTNASVRDFVVDRLVKDTQRCHNQMRAKLFSTSEPASTRRAAFATLARKGWLEKTELLGLIEASDTWIAARSVLVAVGKQWLTVDEALILSLQDMRRRVAKTALVLASRHSAYVSAQRALGLLSNSDEPWRYCLACNVFSHLDFWEWLEVLIRSKPHLERTQEWQAQFAKWLSRERYVATEPSAAQTGRIHEALSLLPKQQWPRGVLNMAVARKLSFE
jgi:hypothetical protein